MSITYPRSLPSTPGFRSIQMIAHSTTAITRSIFTGEQQVFKYHGEYWRAIVELPPMERADAEAWIALLLSLRGQNGTFYLGDSGGKTPRGTATTVTVNGGAQTGETLALSGTGTLKAGDYLQIGSGTSQRLYKNLQDITLATTADIWPRLRESPTNGASVTLSNAKGVFRLAESKTEWDINTAKHYGITFEALEAI